MNKNFKAASLVLESVWYARDFVFTESEFIDWVKIESAQSSISPSTSEVERVKLALDLWRGTGIAEVLRMLDSQNQKNVLSALSILTGESS